MHRGGLATTLGAALLAALPTLAGTLEVRLSVLDPASFEQRPPQQTTRWLIRGGPGVVIADERAAEDERRIELPPGAYEVIVWEVDSRAAGGFDARIGADTTSIAALLSPANAGLIPDAPAWQAALAAPDRPVASARPAPAAPQVAASAPVRAPAGPAPGPGPDEPPRPALQLGLAAAPGAPVRVLLPQVADAADDLITLSDDGPGWIARQDRGARDEATLTAPEAPGRYRIDYLAVPAMEVLATMTLEVR